MTPAERQAASQDASVLFYVAMAQLGNKAVEDGLALWRDVPPMPNVTGTRQVTRWLATAVTYVKRRRQRATDLALAYYRYQRALWTGTTVAWPGRENPPYMSLPELKREFASYLDPDTQEEVEDEAQSETPIRRMPEWARLTAPTRAPEVEEEDPDAEAIRESQQLEAERDQILVEEARNLERELQRINEEAEREAVILMNELGPKNQERKIQKIDSDSIEDIDAERQQAHEEAGRRQAATLSRIVMNGARGTVHHLGTRDRKVIGFARVSKTGTPCGFCAMLISRGFIALDEKGRLSGSDLFRSAQKSGKQADGTVVTFGDLDLYHDNCQCYAEPIFAPAQLESDLFAMNREYARLWPIVTKGLGGDAARAAWRRFIREQAKTRKAQEAASQGDRTQEVTN